MLIDLVAGFLLVGEGDQVFLLPGPDQDQTVDQLIFGNHQTHVADLVVGVDRLAPAMLHHHLGIPEFIIDVILVRFKGVYENVGAVQADQASEDRTDGVLRRQSGQEQIDQKCSEHEEEYSHVAKTVSAFLVSF